jgi:hypothetical protein
MAIAELHQGVLVRQILSGKRKVRIAFVPDDTSQSPKSMVRINDDGEKRSWTKLLGNPAGLDIDTGITILRFNTDNLSGYAFFMPGKSKLETICNAFQQTNAGGSGTAAGLTEFNACLDGKRNAATAANAQFDFLGSVSECVNQL